MEAEVVTGAAKSLLDFCRAAQEHAARAPGETRIETSVATFVRAGSRRDAAPPDTSPPASIDDAHHTMPAPNQFVAAARELGLIVDVIPERFRFDPRVLTELRRIVAERRPHVIVSYHVKSHFVVKASGLWRHYPWVAFHHGYTTTDLKMRAYNYLDRWSLPSADRVLTVCEAFARELSERKGVRPEQLRVQHNSIRREDAIDPLAGRALRSRLGIAEDEKVILAAGRFSREKAHVDLIEALGHLRREYPALRARLLIAGDGPERARMDRLAAQLRISESIVYAGQVRDMRPFYAAADVMALPSHSEGSPFVLLEAMAARVPVVATAVGGVPEMVRHEESALLVPARASRQLAAALGRVLSETELARRLADRAFALTATRYAPEAYFRALADFYVETAQIRSNTESFCSE
ncbi:MAG: glycosyltransferase [Acidobacteria bacterium]|nr:glycosyltransferase [Acidobacteriota bacterium]